MVFSKRELEGYVCIDHTDSPGFTPDEARAAGRLQVSELIGAGKKLETFSQTCSHCEKIVVLRPDRTRERCWCWSCDHYICDDCGAEAKLPGYQHASYRQKLDAYLKHVTKKSIILP